MPLVDIWKADKNSVLSMSIEQIASIAGDGNLVDNSLGQNELREYLTQASTDSLSAYASHCLEKSFAKSGQVLQDVVNELGRRLEYSVTNGRYQGVKNAIGFDGLWVDESDRALVVEVKTTDAYRMSLDTMSAYRAALIAANKIGEDSSIVIVVGRTDTGELEAQVRGSRHAWHIRIIGVESLIKLVRIKESAGSQDTMTKIRTLLAPREYTRLDGLVEVVFAATKDVETLPAELTVDAPEPSSPKAHEKTAAVVIAEVRDGMIASVSAKLKVPLIKRSGALFWSPDHSARVVCTISKRYESKGTERYWYAYHPTWDAFLGEASTGFLALGCVGLPVGYALPLEVVRSGLPYLNVTERPEGGRYWHMKIREDSTGERFLLGASEGADLQLKPYEVSIAE